MNCKSFLFIFSLCLLQCLGKPAVEPNALTEGRGIGSTLWSWLTYPFSWWSTETEQPPVTDQLIAPTSLVPLDTIEIGRHNVTIWCNDQTCTTQKCDKFVCRNITCNIYDTDFMGECREYNTISTREERVPSPTVPMPKPLTIQTVNSENESTLSSTSAPLPTTTLKKETTAKDVEEHPLELEMVLSSTVKDEKNPSLSIPEQKI